MSTRHLSALDELISHADRLIREALGPSPSAIRPNPGNAMADTQMSEADRIESGRLMRVNHAGEIAAQALYHGQAVTAELGTVRTAMVQAAREEQDHLAWCEERLLELGTPKSLLHPLWYAGSFAIGALAGLAGDRTSLGFVAETERQVVEHLSDHLERLPEADQRSRAILEQMQEDEARHGSAATHAGGELLPMAVRGIMRIIARVMTRTAYWI